MASWILFRCVCQVGCQAVFSYGGQFPGCQGDLGLAPPAGRARVHVARRGEAEVHDLLRRVLRGLGLVADDAGGLLPAARRRPRPGDQGAAAARAAEAEDEGGDNGEAEEADTSRDQPRPRKQPVNSMAGRKLRLDITNNVYTLCDTTGAVTSAAAHTAP